MEGYSIVWGRQHKMIEPLMLITYAPWDGLEIDEFSDCLESIILSSEPLLITGDFNIHVWIIQMYTKNR